MLLCACGEGFDESVQLLLQAGADTKAKDKEGKTALDMSKDTAVRTLLKRKRSDLSNYV